MVEFEILIHSSLNMVSGTILILIGLVVLFRGKNYRINQLLFGFFIGLALFELFDGFTVAFRRDPSLEFLNILRDIALSTLIVGMGLILLAALVIYYGEESVFQIKWILLWVLFIVFAITAAVIGDNIPLESLRSGPPPFYLTAIINRDFIGHLGISGALILLAGLSIGSFSLLIYNSQRPELRNKLLRLLFGFILILSMILVLDLRLIFADVRMFIAANDSVHFSIHGILFAGELLILSAFWSPLGSQTRTQNQKMVPSSVSAT